MNTCDKHDGDCDVIVTFPEDSPLAQLPLGHDLNIQSTRLDGPTVAYRVAFMDRLLGGRYTLHGAVARLAGR